MKYRNGFPESRGWAFVHNVVAHPLMSITNNHWIAGWFHDWTARRAWPEN